MPSSPAWTVTSSPLSKRTSERLPVLSRISGLVAVDFLLGEHAERLRRRAERARALEHIGEGMPLDLDGQRLAPAGRHPDVEIARIRRNALDRTALAPEVAADDAHARAVVVDDSRESRRP